MKPFDLESALAGDPICTTDGTPARIVERDADTEQPIKVLHPDFQGIWHYADGRPNISAPARQLFMAEPESEPGPKTAPFDLEKALAGHPLVNRAGEVVTGVRRRSQSKCRDSIYKIATDGPPGMVFTELGSYWSDERENRKDLLLDLSTEPTPQPEALAAQVASLVAENRSLKATLEEIRRALA